MTNSNERLPEGTGALPKAPTGIPGLDEITGGGLPRGRPTLVCGGAGCGKTLLAAEFLLRGARDLGEPGVILSFEEGADELADNLRSMGFDLRGLEAEGKVVVDSVRLARAEVESVGEWDLEGLFIRLGHAVDRIGAKRVMLDTPEALFAALPDEVTLRAELARLFQWLRDRGLTTVITAERGTQSLTRHGLEEYVADCVVLLDHRIVDQVSTRRLRVVKYRGSAHGTNEYPFLITPRGLSVMPITSLRLDHEAPAERVSMGVPDLDGMLGGRGVFRGSSVLVSGSPGTGKSSIAASFVAAACARGERALMFSYEESRAQLVRNMASVGIDLARWIEAGLLEIVAARPTVFGLEQHLVSIHDRVLEFSPDVVVIDPINNLTLGEHDTSLKPTLMRLFDFLKQRRVTGLYTSLASDHRSATNEQDVQVSSLMDTWLLLGNRELNGERTRTLQIIKSRGMKHSNQVREFVLDDHGLTLVDVYMAGNDVLTGAARVAQQSREGAVPERRT